MVKFNMQVIGRKLASARKKAKINQDVLAQYLGIDQSLVSKYESGERPITMDALDKLADLFRCSLDYFLFEKKEETLLENIATRGSSIDGESLKSLVKVNRILNNLQEMEQMLKEAETNE